jgi:hypothetical protein
LLFSEGEKATLAEIAHRLGREALENLATTANPDTILGLVRIIQVWVGRSCEPPVTKMQRKSRKMAVRVKQMATTEGENDLREFAPTC